MQLKDQTGCLMSPRSKYRLEKKGGGEKLERKEKNSQFETLYKDGGVEITL